MYSIDAAVNNSCFLLCSHSDHLSSVLRPARHMHERPRHFTSVDDLKQALQTSQYLLRAPRQDKSVY